MGRDGWLCLEGMREGDREGEERYRHAGVLPYETHLIAFFLFSFPPSSARYTSVYQVPSVSGLI